MGTYWKKRKKIQKNKVKKRVKTPDKRGDNLTNEKRKKEREDK